MPQTPAEINQHLAKMLRYGLNNLVGPRSVWARRLMRWGKEYVQNGTGGTVAERREAVRVMRRLLFQNMTNKDPDTDSHFFTHWQAEAEGEDD